YVDSGEISSIDGFDEDTASEIQSRAREYLEKIEAEHDEKRKALGVEDELREIPGITTAMMVTLGEDGVKTIEDFAGYAVDDLIGWKERKDGETKVFPGVLADHGVSRAEAEEMVLAARKKAGWISEEESAAEEEAAAGETVGA
ncbi:MAG: transcription termination/antitermination protein NusA, partial [Mesorhizobium sp.]